MRELLLALAALFNVGLNVFFKLGSERDAPLKFVFIAIGLLLGGGYAYCFARALEKLDLGVAYPVFAGASVILTMATGLLVFGESFAWTKVIGAVLILGGIVIAFR